jgi:ketosteroid isomerase-like protein
LCGPRRCLSQENVERIRRAFAGTTAGDFSYLPGLIDDNCEFQLPPNFPGTRATRGPEGFLSVVKDWVYTFREEKVVKMEAYLDRREALEAVGVSE